MSLVRSVTLRFAFSRASISLMVSYTCFLRICRGWFCRSGRVRARGLPLRNIGDALAGLPLPAHERHHHHIGEAAGGKRRERVMLIVYVTTPDYISLLFSEKIGNVLANGERILDADRHRRHAQDDQFRLLGGARYEHLVRIPVRPAIRRHGAGGNCRLRHRHVLRAAAPLGRPARIAHEICVE